LNKILVIAEIALIERLELSKNIHVRFEYFQDSRTKYACCQSDQYNV